MKLSAFRSKFPITRDRAYLFSGAMAPACDATFDALRAWTRVWQSRPLENYDAVTDETAALRRALARLFSIEPRRVALTDNTSRASNTAVRLLASSTRSNVVVDETTYPSSRYPWLTMTALTPRVATREPGQTADEAVIRCIDDQTAAVSISHVAPLTGLRHDLRPIADAAHRHGAVLIVDVAQTAGCLPLSLDAEGVDLAVGTTMKWLLGPPGLGFLCLREDLLANADGLDVGYMGLDVPDECWPQDTLPTVLPDSRRLELGFPSLPALKPATAGIELLLEVGLDAIERQIVALATYCIAGLADLGISVRTPQDPARRAGVIAFDLAQASELARYLARRGVDIGGYEFGLGRVDPHAFNTRDEIDQFLTGVKSFLEDKPEGP